MLMKHLAWFCKAAMQGINADALEVIVKMATQGDIHAGALCNIAKNGHKGAHEIITVMAEARPCRAQYVRGMMYWDNDPHTNSAHNGFQFGN